MQLFEIIPRPRPTGNTWTPATEALFPTARAGNIQTYNLKTNGWDKFALYIQPPKNPTSRLGSAAQYIQKTKAGWVNEPKTWPQIQSIAMDWGLVRGIKINKHWTIIEVFNLKLPPPGMPGAGKATPEELRSMFETKIHRFYSINAKGTRIDGRPGGVYIILASPTGLMFIETNKLRPV